MQRPIRTRPVRRADRSDGQAGQHRDGRRVTDTCLQLFGGYGYMVEYPISRYWVDARIQRIYGGSSEIMKEVIARSLVGR
ncbi:MAG: acyl-CoA dehydrogenase family protein [Nevskia sp.]|nr:acyl-CoA dehydrogenase family protein [Nevskia sp.]